MISVLEHSNDVLHDLMFKGTQRNGDGQCRPDIQYCDPSHRRFAVEDNFEVQAERYREHDGSPPSTHVQQFPPSVFEETRFRIISEHAEIKYAKKDFIRKRVNCDIAWYNTTVSARCSALNKTTYLDFVWSNALEAGGGCSPRPSIIDNLWKVKIMPAVALGVCGTSVSLTTDNLTTIKATTTPFSSRFGAVNFPLTYW